MNKPAFRTIAGAVVIVAAAVLLWRRQDNPRTPGAVGRAELMQTSKSPTAKPVSVALPPNRGLSPAAQGLLADLERALSRLDVRSRESVLTFKDDEAFHRFLNRAHAAGLSILGRVDALRSLRVRFDHVGALEADIAGNADDYAAAGANVLFTIPQPPAREDRAAVDQVPFGNRTLGFLGAENNHEWGRGVVVAVLDTGIASDATFGNRLRALDIGLGASPGSGASDGHGTSVASLAAGAAADAGGVAPAASVLGIRVTDTSGTSDMFTLSHAIVAAVDAGAKIVNISLGGYATGAVLDAALAYAGQRGAIVVAAAGNDQAAQLAWPAADPRVVSVGAIDAAEQQVSFSNSGEQLRLTAPGYGVQTAWLEGQRAYVNGTSASAPLVAGAIAAVMSQNPSLTPQQAVQVLVDSASEAGMPGVDPAFGHGILNLGWAMNRGNAGYVDTAVASHFYDAASNQMQFLIQNRSGRAVTGMTLNVAAGKTSQTYSVPSLGPGESYVARVPVDQIALRSNGSLPFTTQLTNPIAITDQVPANNRRSSVLKSPSKP